MNVDQKFMHRCLELASLGWPKCRPNPMVGAVVVHNGEIIGEGYHRKYGQAHAEVNAINSVENKALLNKATLFVSLEPCSHHGQTPPCSDLIITHKIPKVVIAIKDSFSKVQGRGIQKLKDAGVDVTLGVLENEAYSLNKRFFCFHEKKRPYVILKWAESADGFIDGSTSPTESKQRTSSETKAEKISGKLVQQLVHHWRAEEQSILAGGQTVRLDNPQLNVRLVQGPNPLRVVVSETGNIPDSSLLLIDGQETIIYNAEKNSQEQNVEWAVLNFDRQWIDHLMVDLHHRGIQSILVEGGASIHQQFIDSNNWDEIRQIKSDKSINFGVSAPIYKGKEDYSKQIGSDLLTYYSNSNIPKTN